MKIYCCQCKDQVAVRLTDGHEIYPHRKDLWNLPFWKCDACGNHVGCHYKTKNPTTPLGIIPTPEIRAIRQKIHNALDPLWRSGKFKRSDVYRRISDQIGWHFHTANIRSVKEGLEAYQAIINIRKEA